MSIHDILTVLYYIAEVWWVLCAIGLAALIHVSLGNPMTIGSDQSAEDSILANTSAKYSNGFVLSKKHCPSFQAH